MEFLTNKSIKEKDLLLVRKRTFDSAVEKFVDKFPDYWEPSSTYAKALKELIEYIDAIKIEIDKLDIHKIVDKNVTYEFYNSNNVKKLLKFNY
jgi:translation initiation factor 2B subunit (eIF-2B alpha/beta/delta family)